MGILISIVTKSGSYSFIFLLHHKRRFATQTTSNSSMEFIISLIILLIEGESSIINTLYVITPSPYFWFRIILFPFEVQPLWYPYQNKSNSTSIFFDNRCFCIFCCNVFFQKEFYYQFQFLVTLINVSNSFLIN